MRAVLTIAAILWALSGAQERPIRHYIASMFAAQFVGEAYLLLGSEFHRVYLTLYAVANLYVVTTALWVAAKALRGTGLATFGWIVALLQAVLGFAFCQPTNAILLTLAMSAVGMGAAAILTICAAPSTEEKPELFTLAIMWLMQSLFFYLYSAGVQTKHVLAWYGIGEWLPALIVVLGMLKLGFQLRLSKPLLPHIAQEGS